MSELLPAGMIRFRVALGRAAEALCPEAWATAHASDRDLLTDVDNARGVSGWLATSEGSLANTSYTALRISLAQGKLPAFRRGHAGPPETVEPAFWTSSSADRLTGLLKENFLIRAADLEAVIEGAPAPSLAKAISSESPTTNRPNRGGRPLHNDLEPFWIEVCRLVAADTQPRTQAAYTKRMAQWAEDRGPFGYGEETVRKKIGMFFKAAGWR